jgi:uncharacterized Zn-finger protein
VLVALLFLSFLQVTKAAILEDEGTEGNASEYRNSGSGCRGRIDDETSITKVGSYSLKLTTIDFGSGYGVCYSKARTLSSPFRWGQFSSLTIWVFRPHPAHKSFELTLFGIDGRASFRFDISNQRHIWQQYRITKANMSDGGLKTYDMITNMELRLYNRDPGSSLYLDGLEINIVPLEETSKVFMPALIGYLFAGTAVIGIMIVLFVVNLKTDLISNLGTKRKPEKTLKSDQAQILRRYSSRSPYPDFSSTSRKENFLTKRKPKKTLKSDVRKEEIVLVKTVKESRCTFCGEKFRITDTTKYCPWCGTEIPQCTVCLLPIIQGDEFVKCPYCGSFAHKNHLIEWVKVKGSCPYCKERLTEFDLPT